MSDEAKPFPSHGNVSCTLCFSSPGERIEAGPWRFRNDPGHWGSANPRILVLGFSKGATQVNVYNHGKFEDVAFAGARQRLKAVLVTLGLLVENDDINLRFQAEEKDFAFASLIRCSVSRVVGNRTEPTTSGSIIAKAFQEREPQRLLDNCSRRFLAKLLERLKLVVMLGIQDEYIDSCRMMIGSLYGGALVQLNAVAYAAGQVIWVHAAHPSPGNGWFGRWLIGNRDKAPVSQKRELAREAIGQISGLCR